MDTPVSNPNVSNRTSRNLIGAAVAGLIGAAVLLPAFAKNADAPDRGDKVVRGAYLVTVAGCNDCHTPFVVGPNGAEPDMTRMLSGHPQDLNMPPAPRPASDSWPIAAAGTSTAWSGPWGVSFTANLTPDPETGLGSWTFDDFKNTIRSGRHLGTGRPILPPMPIRMYRHFTDEDLEAIFSYLQAIPAIRNKVPAPLPPATRSAALVSE